MSNEPEQTRSLTETEAAERAALITVQGYDIAVDWTGLLEGEVATSVSTITFTSTAAGAATFVDCVGDVVSATLNGTALDLDTVSGGRIPLPDLALDNVLVVASSQSDTGSAAGILRTVDESDDRVYVWTSFEADDARRLWACFDQPDLKAPHRFEVTAPAEWTVLSNLGPDTVGEPEDGARVWAFPPTPPLSTYVVVVNAGPFHEVREDRGGYSLGLYCRQSLRAFLERDAEDLLTVTAQGLAFFGERFGTPFPEPRYDQVFVPGMGGAMENWGCVTWTDAVLHRSEPTPAEQQLVAEILLHEMAHMWFGDLVTMTWWDDLWLNEAFASWAATWAAAHATRWDASWATFTIGSEPFGYELDQSPATHPIRGIVPDVDQAMANFDAITYVKGQAVLAQLVAYVGEETFVEGLRAYFAAHAWGNTRLADLMDAIGSAAGRDLTDWTSAWLDRAGTDRISLREGTLVVTSPDDLPPRPHRLDVASYRLDGGGLRRVGLLEVETTADPLALDLPDADLHQVNHGDLTYAAVHPDGAATRALLTHASALPDQLGRAVAISTLWGLVRDGEVAPGDVLPTTLAVARAEEDGATISDLLALALRLAETWSAPAAVAGRLADVAETSRLLVDRPSHRLDALRTLAASASTPDDLALLARAAHDDIDLAWRVLARRAALGDDDLGGQVIALLDRDPDPDSRLSALAVTAARPDPGAKDEVWREVFELKSVPAGSGLSNVSRSFWQAGQHALLLPYAHRFLDEMAGQHGGGMLNLLSLVGSMMPRTTDDAWAARASEVAAAESTPPPIRQSLVRAAERHARIARAQSVDAG